MPFERHFNRGEILRLCRISQGSTQGERDQWVADQVGCKPRLVRTVRRMADRTAKRGNPWPASLNALACEMALAGSKDTEIAQAVGKSPHAVNHKLRRAEESGAGFHRGDRKARRAIFLAKRLSSHPEASFTQAAAELVKRCA